MKHIAGMLCLFLLLGLLAGCNGNEAVAIPTPKPDPIADVNPESGTLGALAFAITNKLGTAVSAGADANTAATGVGAAKLAVAALGLDLELRMSAMGQPPTDADYLQTALSSEAIPAELFTPSKMTAEEIAAFAQAVADAKENHLGFDSQERQWESAELSVSAEVALRVASLAYNPLAQGRGIYRYAMAMGYENSILYWTLAALAGAKADDYIADSLPFIAVNDQTNADIGTTSIQRETYATLIRELWGLTLPTYTPGLAGVDDLVILSSPPDDLVRQYPVSYRVERSGDLLRITADVLNYVTPPQYAGKAVVILRENPDTLLGWQIASIQGLSDPLPKFSEVYAPTTAEGYQAISLMDGNEKTVWRIGEADVENAFITLKFSEPTTITGLGVYNGDHSSDSSNLRKYARAGVVGIRFSEDATEDAMRVNLDATIDDPVAGFEIVMLFGKEITTDTVHLVFYGPTEGYLRISDIRAF